MLTWEQLEEDLGVIGKPLSEMERKNLFRYVAENSEDPCHMCTAGGELQRDAINDAAHSRNINCDRRRYQRVCGYE